MGEINHKTPLQLYLMENIIGELFFMTHIIKETKVCVNVETKNKLFDSLEI